MIRSAASKVMWVGRATVFLVGLAVILAVVFGMASSAFGANGDNFILGSLNNTATALTKLTGNVNGSAMQVVNNNPDANDTALSLTVQSGEAPMRVNTATKVTNLNADKLDGKEAPLLAGIDEAGFPVSSPDVALAPTDSTRLRTGVYTVPFKQDVKNRRCHRVVSLGERLGTAMNPNAIEPQGGEASSANVFSFPNAEKTIMVATRNSSGALADRPFHLAVFC